jgi:Fur family ferric uptake transcriptional regulator
MHVDTEALLNRCRAAGQRITGPRRLIAEVVAGAADHPDVPEIYRRVAAIDLGISLSTVCRTLKLPAAKRLVERHSFAGGRSQIEAASTTHHDHPVDIDTGVITEFQSDEIERRQKAIASRLGFEFTGYRLVLHRRAMKKGRSVGAKAGQCHPATTWLDRQHGQRLQRPEGRAVPATSRVT